jgi:hypothetical protein
MREGGKGGSRWDTRLLCWLGDREEGFGSCFGLEFPRYPRRVGLRSGSYRGFGLGASGFYIAVDTSHLSSIWARVCERLIPPGI